jgi:flavin prenyltransferase
MVVPCSMKTLTSVRMGYDSDLITRAASVTLKQRRSLVLVARETPLSSVHLENMLEVTRAGAIIMPPVMAFYTRPTEIRDMVEQSTGRMVDMLGVNDDQYEDIGVNLPGGQGKGHSEERRQVWEGFQWDEKKEDERTNS